MYDESRLVSETFLALVTHARLVSGMRFLMLGECGGVAVDVPALEADVRSFSCMKALVDDERRLVPEMLTAFAAHELFLARVGVLVAEKCPLFAEARAALWADSLDHAQVEFLVFG